MTKINRKDLDSLMKDQGFRKAAEWSNEKMMKNLPALQRVKEDSVAAAYKPTFRAVHEAKGKIEIAGGGAPASEVKPEKSAEAYPASKKSKSKSKKSKPSGKPEPEAESETKPAPAKADVPAKPVKEAKPAKEAKAPAEKAVRDAFGCKVGTISAKVNSVLTSDWKEEEDIAKEAGLEIDQARGRLYYAADEGEIERRRLIQYRIKPKTAAPVAKK